MMNINNIKSLTGMASLILLTGIISGYSSQDDTSIIDPTAEKRIYLQVKSKYLFIGAKKCASECHNNEKMGHQYDIWKKSPHADAFNILVSKKAMRYSKRARIKEDPRENAACLNCHTTGANKESLNFAPTYAKEEGVTCEACHKIKLDGKTYIPEEADCLNCHNDSLHKVQKLNFRGDCGKITHPRPAAISQ